MPQEISEMTDDELRAHLHAETGSLPWVDLQKHFARGVVFKVEQGLDLLDVAIVISRDDKVTLEKWLNAKKVAGVEAEDAKKWFESEAWLWTVVVAPWVLVQEDSSRLDS